MKCPNCNGVAYDDVWVCENCQGKGIVEPLTNEEWLHTLSTEEKADWLTDTFDLCGAGCSNCFVKELCFDEHNNKMPGNLILDWLKQQHRG